MGRVRNGVYWPVHCTTFCGTVGARHTVGNLAECSNSVVLSGQGLLAGLTAAPSIPAAQGLFLKPIGIPLEDRSCCWDKVHLLA